ncbi:MAG TPA: ATP-binding protein [Gemmatimonadaceae bacterium]|nr:ATP-binding protein [Gemmatimonadaceae bacterium]
MLTPDQLRDVIAQGEQLDVEFRGEEQGALDDRELVETVSCLANARGGLVLIGVEDDGRITGARPRHGTYTDARRLELMIANQTAPACSVECGVVAVDGRDVVVVSIPPEQPVTATVAGVYRRRATDVHGKWKCVPFLPHEMQSREASRGIIDHSALVVPQAQWTDLDPLELERLRQTIARNAGRADATLLNLPDEEIARALGLRVGTGITIAGLLMVGREESVRQLIPTHEVAFQVMTGLRIAVNEFYRLPLIRVAEVIRERFDARNEEEELAVGSVSVGVPRYSPAGFREALHNALIHRDYTSLGAVHVQWSENEIEISNPGGFPAEVRLENLLVTAPRPRNPVLANAFKRIGLVERTGRGIDTIFEGQLRYGRHAPDYSRSTAEAVHVVLRGGPANMALTRLVAARDRPGQRLGVEELLILNAVDSERRVTVERVAALVQRAEPVALSFLERLVESGVLEAREERRDRVYHFSAATYRALGTPEAFVRVRGIEPIQRESMILQYVASHGRITRAQAADLCQVGPREARAVLEKLVKRGDLVVKGERRGSYYEQAAEAMS